MTESHGMVFLAPEDPITPLGSIPEDADASFLVGELPTVRTRGSAGLLADNFLDVAHFPYVHAGTFGAEEAAEVPPFAVARDGWSFTVSYEHSFANREDPGVAAGVRPLIQTRRLTYVLEAPFHLRLRIDFLDSGGSNVIGFFIQPETDETCRLFTTLWRDDLEGDQARMAEAVAFELEVLRRGSPGARGLPRPGPPTGPDGRGPHPGRPQHAGAASGAGRPGRRAPPPAAAPTPVAATETPAVPR